MRFTLLWPSADRLPTVIVAIARTPPRIGQGVPTEPLIEPRAASASAKKRTRIAKPAAFGPTDRKAVTGVGAPSYTSGVHMWNGAALILYPKPASMHTTATNTTSGTR